ncbi:PAS domain-containing protein [Aureibaculum sp. A20]|uniref:histidine kinase n=1 Tax=Aureibaculum flavum TaxID=2795986 RepID=A0ABS0WQW2_9FLAO|nr:sensor histidine kinase [Aureibaculum flavum]MBJ2174352.1 PAS domain-containing protein [Aureibaculum flavum]
MDFREILSSTKSYKIALVVAVALLLLLSSISYRQINNMRKSSDLVSASLMVDREVNNLFSKFSLIEAAEYRSLLVNDSTFSEVYKKHKRETEISFLNLLELTKDLPEQVQYLDTIGQWRDSLDLSINKLNKYRGLLEDDIEAKVMVEVSKMASIFLKLNTLRTGMSKRKEALFKQRMVDYKTETFFTPFISLLLMLFSILVFWLAFRKINNSRKELAGTQSFVENIITNSNNLINYFEPVRDDKGKVIDFIFKYSNSKIEDITGVPVENILGTRLTASFPETITNGLFDMYVKCIETGESNDLTRRYIFNDTEVWLKSLVSKLEEGVNVTTSDVTQEKGKTDDLKKLNDTLFLKNTVLNNAEVIAKIGSFTRYSEMGTTDMSDNLYRLIGCEPGEFKPDFENYMTFVHPEDVQEIEKSLVKNLESKEIFETSYRVFTKNGKLRHFKSATLMIVENGNKKMVGVVQDITQSVKKDKKLERKNKALIRTNDELASFNRVVSHDLQEPLRKIQMFISLLSETERTNLSDKGVTFFDKIDDSAGRMQLLIKNLLTYSRIDDSHEDFQEIDLNKKLEKVEDNLSERIKESNISIVKKNLPIINGIPFQMEQLFNNLLSNAIKYRSKTEKAKILIDVTTVHKDQIPLPYKKPAKNYHKIIISDNGIGFDQENAEKIFEIFERLHQKNEYSGTGVGLAICKKIVDNHHGFIHATSELGKGTTFYIYLPL